MKPTRDDLWIDVYAETGEWINAVHPTDADLAAMGLVQAPECGECGGSGSVSGWPDTPWEYCPRCGGSGYGRLVPEHERDTYHRNWREAEAELDAFLQGVDAEALRVDLKVSDVVGTKQLSRIARQVLADLDGEEA